MVKSKPKANKIQQGNEGKTKPPKPTQSRFNLIISFYSFLIVILAIFLKCSRLFSSDGVYESTTNHNNPYAHLSPKETPFGRNILRESGISSFQNIIDPHLKLINYTLDPHNESVQTQFLTYIPPDVNTFYQGDIHNDRSKENRAVIQSTFTGFSGKFLNLSPENLTLRWKDGTSTMLISNFPPMEAVGTATYTGHEFIITPPDNPNDVRALFRVHNGQNTYVYDPIISGQLSLDQLDETMRRQYHLQKQNLLFAKQYKSHTGREWLSLFPKRKQPVHKMWNADYFGQTHWVETSETHFMTNPPPKYLFAIKPKDMQNQSVVRPLQEYRKKHQPKLNMTLKVLSCSPRVFEINNFLSPVEINHILYLVNGKKLESSKTASFGVDRSNSTTRTSRNTWIKRESSIIIDTIYRRAADLLRIDEALLRERGPSERKDILMKSSSAEHLQLVHYDIGEKYTPHHDFTHPRAMKMDQPARFATLLLYLNEGMVGGNTSFPRWQNAHTSDDLEVVPELGKAILFYSLLPDGNFDDLSEHEAKPVISGEKWLINLWIWDPLFYPNY